RAPAPAVSRATSRWRPAGTSSSRSSTLGAPAPVRSTRCAAAGIAMADPSSMSSPAAVLARILTSAELEEVGEEDAPALAGDRFGVELNAPHGQRAVPQGEDLVLPAGLVRPGHDLQLGRQRRGVDDERVTARGHERRVQAAEEIGAAVRDGRELAVHHAPRAHDGGAERGADRLVAETHAQDGDGAGEAADAVDADACLDRKS